MAVSIDMDQVVQQTVQQLGAQNASLLLELNATRAANEALSKRVEELEAAQQPVDPPATEGGSG